MLVRHSKKTMPTSKGMLLRKAISERLLVEFDYDGYHRVVEPHVYGKKEGEMQLLAYQITGESASDALPEWRRFDIDKISHLRLTNRHFKGPRRTRSGEHGPFDEFILIVSP